jgi:crossover junction endodeoxyribonuclease RuvC
MARRGQQIRQKFGGGPVVSLPKSRMMLAMKRGPSCRTGSSTGTRARRGAILGVDPGLERTGYALLSASDGPREAYVHEAGIVRLARQASLPQRLAHLEENLETLIRAHSPVLLACEELYAHYKHPRTAILMGHARGVILAAAARSRIEVLTVAATHVKKVLTGNGHASKAQMQRAVAATLGLRVLPEPSDVADAIAIALCGLRISRGRRSGRSCEEVDR